MIKSPPSPLFFLLISDKGAVGSYFQDLSQDARSKIERHLETRETMIQQLSSSLLLSEQHLRKIILGSFGASRDAIFSLQHIVKKLSRQHHINQTKHCLNNVLVWTSSLELQIRLYLTRDLLADKSYVLSPKASKTMAIRRVPASFLRA